MGKKPSLTTTTRAQVFALKQEGYTERQLAVRFKCSKTAIHQAIIRYQETGSFEDKRRSGRPRITSARDDSVMKRIAIRSPSSSIKKIKAGLLEHGCRVSSTTVSRRLSSEFGLKSCKPAKKPRLTPVMKTKRLEFARRHLHWTENDWARVLFSDESTLQQFNTRKRQVRRPPGKRFDSRYAVETMKHPPSQMIWGAMSVVGTAGLYFLEKNCTMNGERYLNLLKDKLNLHMGVHGTSIFMHDGAPCHRSKIVSEFLKRNNITVLEWPGNSPDLNPIENLWCQLKDKVAEKQPSSGQELNQAIKTVWVKEIHPDYCKRLVASMPRRLEAVIQNRGGHTKY